MQFMKWLRQSKSCETPPQPLPSNMELLPALLALGEGHKIEAHHRQGARADCNPLHFVSPPSDCPRVRYSAATALSAPGSKVVAAALSWTPSIPSPSFPQLLLVPSPPLAKHQSFPELCPQFLSSCSGVPHCRSGSTPTSGSTSPTSEPASGRASPGPAAPPTGTPETPPLGFRKWRSPTWQHPLSLCWRWKARFVLRDCQINCCKIMWVSKYKLDWH